MPPTFLVEDHGRQVGLSHAAVTNTIDIPRVRNPFGNHYEKTRIPQ